MWANTIFFPQKKPKQVERKKAAAFRSSLQMIQLIKNSFQASTILWVLTHLDAVMFFAASWWLLKTSCKGRQKLEATTCPRVTSFEERIKFLEFKETKSFHASSLMRLKWNKNSSGSNYIKVLLRQSNMWKIKSADHKYTYGL